MSDSEDVNPASDLDNLVKEIESSGGSCSNVIRKLVDRGRERGEARPECSDFFAKLDERLQEQDQEIERMCNYHYQSFVDSTREVRQVESDAEQLREALSDTNTTVLSAVKSLQENVRHLASCKSALDNIERGSTALQMCLPVLDKYLRLEKKIQEGRCYPALKMLEQLKHNLLPLVSKYRFAAFIEDRLPDLRVQIERRGESELTDYLENVHRRSVQLGAIAMRQVARQYNLGIHTGASFAAILSGRGSGTPASERRLKEPLVNGARIDGIEAEKLHASALEEDIRASLLVSNDKVEAVDELIDFGPLYRRLHIAQVLGEREKFERQYQRVRGRQCLLVLQSTSHQHQETNFGEYFSRIVGFFVVDEYVHHMLPRLITSDYLADTWHKAASKLADVVGAQTAALDDAASLLNLKDYCLLFGHVMRSFGFNPSYAVNEMVLKVRRRCDELMAKRWAGRFKEIVQSDDYTAMQLQDKAEYDALLEQYPCSTAEFDALPFPKRLPFSAMVPRIYVSLREYIDVCIDFSRNVDLSETELNHQIAMAANTFFMSSLRACLLGAIRENRPGLLQLIQLSVNMDELEVVSNKLEEYIRHRVADVCATASSATLDGAPAVDSGLQKQRFGSSPPGANSTSEAGGATSSRLNGVALFRDIRSEAESHIYATLNLKIDVFIDVGMYDWTADGSASPTTETHEVSQAVADLIEFLTNNFKSFTHLPPKVAQTACLSSCKYIASKLTEFLTSGSSPVKLVSRTTLLQMDKDLRACEDFARGEPVPGVDGSTLLLAFKDLRQLLNLVLAEDFAVYLSEQRRQRSAASYDRVTPGAVIRLLEKMREFDKRRAGILTGLSKQVRERRRRLEDVCRQLKELQASTSSG